jgi:hypothetical protein
VVIDGSMPARLPAVHNRSHAAFFTELTRSPPPHGPWHHTEPAIRWPVWYSRYAASHEPKRIQILAKAPGINELRNLLSHILHERDAEDQKGYSPMGTCNMYLYNAMIWIKCSVSYMVFCLSLSTLFLFIVSLNKMASPHICTHMYASIKTPTYPKEKFRYFLSKHLYGLNIRNWYYLHCILLYPPLSQLTHCHILSPFRNSLHSRL